jgi:hypothetical protein
MAYHDRAFAPAAVPVARDEADPITLAPDAMANGDLRVELNTDLEVALKCRFWDGQSTRAYRLALEATIHHCVEIPLLGSLHRRRRGSIGSKLQNRALGVMLLHRIQVGGTFEQMSTLTTGVLRTHGLAIDALRRQTLDAGEYVVQRAGVRQWGAYLVSLLRAELDEGGMDIAAGR